MKLKLASFIFLFSFLCSCNKTKSNSDSNNTDKETINYLPVSADFPNPERGFYRYSETYASNFVPLVLNQLKNYRTEQLVSTANYNVISTLVFRYYVLNGFTNLQLSATLLSKINTDFDIARQAGVKLIPRFTYTVTPNAGSCPEGLACPPYGDAPKAIVINHINQLKPIFTNNADVIACVQLGFIGIWGENYYTDYFGDPSQNLPTQKLLNNNWQDRIDVLQAMLNAVPKDRMIQIRYPQFKQRFAYGINASINSAALTEAEAFSEADKARIAFHNDCFLSSSNDVGTFEDYGNSTTPRSDAASVVTALRNYKKQDSKYVAVGGETCDDAFSPQNDCEAVGGRAETEMAEMHYSFLHAEYNTAVNNDWQSGGCMANVRTKLGYRFILSSADFSKKASQAKPFDVTINIQNIGYASPYNARPVQLLLRNKNTGAIKKFDFNTEIRKWFTGYIKLEQSFTLTPDVVAGTYDVLLNMPDKYASINTRSDFSIRLANFNLWEDTTGYNKLNFVLTVE